MDEWLYWLGGGFLLGLPTGYGLARWLNRPATPPWQPPKDYSSLLNAGSGAEDLDNDINNGDGEPAGPPLRTLAHLRQDSTFNALRGRPMARVLFPLFGVTPGVTTVTQLARLGSQATLIDSDSGRPYAYYVVSGHNFWHHNGTVVERMYETYTNPMPELWQKAGFDWRLSYDQWMELMEWYGWSLRVKQEPHVEPWQGSTAFTAELAVTSGDLELELDFSYSEGTSTRRDRRTLYSISLRWLPADG